MKIDINVDFFGSTIISKEYNINTTLGKLLLDALENDMANGEIQIFIPSKFELQLIKTNYSELKEFDITDEELFQAKKNAYNNTLDKIEYHSGEPTFDDGWSSAIDYIRKKSIRPQNRWKESLATADLENSLCDIQDAFSDTSYEYRILGEAIEFIRCTEPKLQ